MMQGMLIEARETCHTNSACPVHTTPLMVVKEELHQHFAMKLVVKESSIVQCIFYVSNSTVVISLLRA
jgi:hypothetical protein